MHTGTFCGVVLMTALLRGSDAFADAYTYQTFGVVGGTHLYSVNSSGALIGNDANHGNFLYENGVFTTLNDPLGYSTSPGVINDMGVIAGTYASNTPSGGVGHGFLYQNGVYTTFDVPGAIQTALAEINASGAMVGAYYDGSGFYGFVDTGGTISKLADPLAVGGTFPVGINDSGEIVGNYTDSNNVQHGFVYANGVYTTVDAPGETVVPLTGIGITLNGINDAGDIVGTYFTGPLSDVGQLSFVDIGGIFTTLAEPDEILAPDQPVGDLTFVSGISNSGVVVGNYLDSHPPHVGNPDYGFIATPIQAAVSVDEPGSLLLLGAGLLSVAMLRRRQRQADCR